MGQAESFVSQAKRKISNKREIDGLGDYIEVLFETAYEIAIESKISEKIDARDREKLDIFVENLISEKKSSGDSKKALTESLTRDALKGGPVFRTLVGVFQSMQTLRGSIFECILEDVFQEYNIDYENKNKKRYPDFFIFDKEGNIIAFVTAKVSIRERYNQAIREKSKMESIGYENIPFYLATLETKISPSSESDLEANKVDFFGKSHYGKLIKSLKNEGD